MRKGLVFILAISMSMLFAACGDDSSPVNETPNNPVVEFEGGDYDGDLDENGMRSGQGIWICDDFRYEGSWENDMPNGPGTLFRTNPEPGMDKAIAFVAQAEWVNGYAEGNIEYGFLYEDGHSLMWGFFVSDGRPPVEMMLTLQKGPSLVVDNSNLYAVPPFAPEVETDSSLPAPTEEQSQQFFANKNS